MLEIDTAETSDGTVLPSAAELASASVPCATRSRHPSRSFATVMFSASFVALTTSLSFHPFISSRAHSRLFVLCPEQTGGKGGGGRRPRSVAESDISVQLGDEPDLTLFFGGVQLFFLCRGHQHHPTSVALSHLLPSSH